MIVDEARNYDSEREEGIYHVFLSSNVIERAVSISRLVIPTRRQLSDMDLSRRPLIE